MFGSSRLHYRRDHQPEWRLALPIHGSAFDITGKGIANPIATFWTAAMMLEHLGEKDAAARLMAAVERVTANSSLHTPDLGGKATMAHVTEAVCNAVRRANV